jgi:hypothetical protein
MVRKSSGGPHWHQWGEDEARSALVELSTSGLSAAEFARRRGYSTQRLAYWKKRLDSDGGPAFVAVTLPPSADRHVEISAGEVVVRVREDLDAERLAEIAIALSRRISAC